MTDVKVSASFILPGSVLPAEPPLLKKGKKKKRKNKKKKEEKTENTISYKKESIKVDKKETIVINLRVAKPAKQVININSDAYAYMVSQDSPAPGFKLFEWKRMTVTKRLRVHLGLIAESLGGKLEAFKVLDD